MQTRNRIVTSESADFRRWCYRRRQRLPEQPRAPTENDAQRPIRSVEELREFVNDNANEIFAKAHLLCYGSPDNAREVVQELYPRLLSMLERSPSGLRNPWAAVHRVGARLAIDCHRKQVTARRTQQLADEGEVPDARQVGTDNTTERSLVHAAIAQLPERQQAIVRGIFFEGRKAKDVATDIRLSQPRLTELKQTALRQLRTLLCEEG